MIQSIKNNPEQPTMDSLDLYHECTRRGFTISDFRDHLQITHQALNRWCKSHKVIVLMLLDAYKTMYLTDSELQEQINALMQEQQATFERIKSLKAIRLSNAIKHSSTVAQIENFSKLNSSTSNKHIDTK